MEIFTKFENNNVKTGRLVQFGFINVKTKYKIMLAHC